jgi:hypothetical protein
LKKSDLKVEVTAEQYCEAGYRRMIEISKSFNEINSQKRKNIINPETGLQIWLVGQRK